MFLQLNYERVYFTNNPLVQSKSQNDKMEKSQILMLSVKRLSSSKPVQVGQAVVPQHSTSVGFPDAFSCFLYSKAGKIMVIGANLSFHAIMIYSWQKSKRKEKYYLFYQVPTMWPAIYRHHFTHSFISFFTMTSKYQTTQNKHSRQCSYLQVDYNQV